MFNITTPQPAPGVLPPYAHDLDFANVTFPRIGWIQAFLVAKFLQPFIPSEAALDAEISRQIPFINSIVNFTTDQS